MPILGLNSGMLMPEMFAKFLQNNGAATVIEYSLMLGLVAIASVAAFVLLGQGVDDMYGRISSSVIYVMPAGE